MQERDLTAIGADIATPAAAAYGSTRARRERVATAGSSGDRLTELAGWWATVAGTAPPRRVEQLWLPRASPAGPATADVVLRRFDAPSSVADALAWGVAVADDAVDDGTDLLLLSLHPEDRDEISWQVLAAHLLDIDPVEATGWPSADRITDAQWSTRVAALRDGLRRVRGIRNEPERLLAELGSPALAAGTGLLLQAAARRTPALLDGPAAAACALLAHRVARAGRRWWQACDAGHLGLHDRILTELRLPPLTRLGLPMEDGTSARISLVLLETAITRAIEGDTALPDDEPDELELVDLPAATALNEPEVPGELEDVTDADPDVVLTDADVVAERDAKVVAERDVHVIGEGDAHVIAERDAHVVADTDTNGMTDLDDPDDPDGFGVEDDDRPGREPSGA